MRPQEIKSKLVRHGIRQADIARKFDPPITRQAVYRTIHGITKSEKIQEAISSALKLPVSKVFPKKQVRK